MPLVPTVLQTEITKIIDQDSPLFEGFPADSPEVAERWSEAIRVYTQSIIPVSINGTLAKQAMYSSLLAINSQTPTGLTIFCAGVLAFATSLGLVMNPALTATQTPAPLEPLLSPIMISGFAGATSAVIAPQMATAIDGWFRTGIAINNTSGVTIPWS